MRKLIGITLIAAFTLTACSTDDAEPSEPWMEPANYTYTVNSSCGEQWPIGTFEIVVKDHTVTSAAPLDSSAQSLLDHSGLAHIPTLQQLVGEYQIAVDDGEYGAEIEQAPLDGHPTLIVIDGGQGIDDKSCYLITDYSPAN